MIASAIKLIRDNLGFTLSHTITVGCVVAMGTAATLIAGTILWNSHSHKVTNELRDRILKREHARKQQHDALRAELEFDALLWSEYDAMLLSAPAGAAAAAAAAVAAAPITLTTPRGDVVTMTYANDRAAFGYYTDRKDNVTYAQLETVARSFLVHNSRPDLAREAYADRRIRASDPVAVAAMTTATVAAAAAAPTKGDGGGGGGGGIFAMFRRYNRKPEDPPKNEPLKYTRFVYLGTMRDYDAPVRVKWDIDCCDQPYENIDYADFKLKCRTANAAADAAADAVDTFSTSNPERVHSSSQSETEPETETETDDE
jgi:hypothetical protein